MTLSIQEVEHIAKLARLELTDEEKARYREQLSAILDHVAQLSKLDTANVPPMTAVFGSDSHLRKDKVRKPLGPRKLLKNAPDHDQDQFKVPAVFE